MDDDQQEINRQTLAALREFQNTIAEIVETNAVLVEWMKRVDARLDAIEKAIKSPD